jgi:hypothetical protein
MVHPSLFALLRKNGKRHNNIFPTYGQRWNGREISNTRVSNRNAVFSYISSRFTPQLPLTSRGCI